MKKRGRPTKFSSEKIAMIKHLFPEIRSKRGITNQCYMIRAFGVLQEIEGMEYILDEKQEALKPSLLTELGLLETEQEIIDVSHFICEKQRSGEKSTVKEWNKIIRVYRLSRIRETASEIT